MERKKIAFFKFWKDVLFFNPFHLVIIFILIYLAIAYLTNKWVYTNVFYYTVLGDDIDFNRIENIIKITNNSFWIYNTLHIVLLIAKFYSVSMLIFIAGFLFNRSLEFINCFKVVLIAEFASVIGSISKLLYFLIDPPQTLNDIKTIFPLSLVQLFDIQTMPNYLIYPFSLFNIFEVAYWIILIFGVSYLIKEKIKTAFLLVASTYGMGLLIWVLIVMFIQVQFS